MDRNTGRGPPERNRQTKEAMAELGAQEAMAVQGAQEAMAVARGSGGHGSAGSSGGNGRWSLWPWPRSTRPGPYSQNPFTPQKNFPGEVRGYQEPSRASHRQTGQDIPQEPLPPPRQGGRRLEWPPWPQQEEPPAPDESPWTRHDKTR